MMEVKGEAMRIDDLYIDVGKVVKGVCDKVYAKNRPKSVDEKVGSYIVVRLPSGIYNEEIGADGSYNDYTTILQIEIYVRNVTSRQSPNGFALQQMGDKVDVVMKLFPISTEHLTAIRPMVVLQADDGDGYDAAIIQARLRTR